jgi:hypothetical protein
MEWSFETNGDVSPALEGLDVLTNLRETCSQGWQKITTA